MDERLIFVTLQGSIPRRKVAVPVPDGMTWDHFVAEVAARLKLHSVGDMKMASTGARVTSLDTLQDIDELSVIDGGSGPSTSGALLGGAPPRGGRAAASGGHRVAAADTEITPADGYANGASPFDGVVSVGGAAADDDDDKYGPRSGGAARALARLFPALVPAASLPLTRQDAQDGRRSGRGGRGRSAATPARARRKRRALLALVAAAALFLVVANMWRPGVLGWGGGARAVDGGAVVN